LLNSSFGTPIGNPAKETGRKPQKDEPQSPHPLADDEDTRSHQAIQGKKLSGFNPPGTTNHQTRNRAKKKKPDRQ
jgi:hypothetical protein